MWFSNALIYHCDIPEEVNLPACFSTDVLKPCPPHARFIYGWLPVLADELLHEVRGARLFCLGKEERVLPRGVLKHALAARIQAFEQQQQRPLKKAEKSQLAENLEFELLPKSFCMQKKLLALHDMQNKRLIVNTASPNQASQLVSLLRKSVPSLHLEPLIHHENIALRLARWISEPSALPSCLQLASDCLLFSLENEKKRINCKGYELPAEEILTLLSQGLAAAEISLIWRDRIQLTLTHDLTFKRLKCMDYLLDDFNEIRQLEAGHEQQDAALILMAGELRALLNDFLEAIQQSTSLNEIAAEENSILA